MITIYSVLGNGRISFSSRRFCDTINNLTLTRRVVKPMPVVLHQQTLAPL